MSILLSLLGNHSSTSGFHIWLSIWKDQLNEITWLDKNYVDKTISKKGDRIILVKLVIGGNIINMISVYASQVGLDEHIKAQFWESMDELMRGIPQGEHIFIGGDFNGHVGKDRGGYEMVHGGLDFGDRNDSGEAIIDFAVVYDLIVANTFLGRDMSI